VRAGARRGFRLLLPLLLGALLPSGTPASPRPQSPDNESREAGTNRSFVIRRVDRSRLRKLEKGVDALLEGEAEKARRIFAPLLLPAWAAAQVDFGRRETRDLGTLIRDLVASWPEARRRTFLEAWEKEARTALTWAGSDPRVLAGIPSTWPGTEVSKRALRRLAALRAERGELEEAAGILRALGLPPPSTRPSGILKTPMPLPGRDLAGTAPGAPKTPPSGPPRALSLWPGNRVLRSSSAVLGRGPEGRILFLLSPTHLLTADLGPDGTLRRPSFVDLRVDLRGPSGESPVLPAASGDRVAFVFGTGPGRSGSAAPLLALYRRHEDGRPRRVWTWRPDRGVPLGGPLLAGDRCFVRTVRFEDKLNAVLSLTCLARNGRPLWSRDLCQGAPLGSDLIESRQEELGPGRLRPAPMAFADGDLFVPTGLGLLFRLDARTGEVRWSFRTARLERLGGKRTPWRRPFLAVGEDDLCFAPSDSDWFYRLRRNPGRKGLLLDPPLPRRSLRSFLGRVRGSGRVYFLREGWLEAGPVRLRLRPEGGAPPKRPRYDAPPFQSGETLPERFLLTEGSLVLVNDRSLYWLDLSKDLYYERALELGAAAPELQGPILPLEGGGVLIAGPRRPWIWR